MKILFCILIVLLFLFMLISCIPSPSKKVESLIILGNAYPDTMSSWGIVLKLNERDLPGNDCLVQWNVDNGTLYYFNEDNIPTLIESTYNDLPYTLTSDSSGGSVVWKPDVDFLGEAEILVEVNVYSNSSATLSNSVSRPAVKSSITLLKNNLQYSIKRTESPSPQ